MKKFVIIAGYILLIFTAISMLFPFFAMLKLSLTPDNQIFSQNNFLLNTNISCENYKDILNSLPITKYFINSMIVAVLTTIGQVFISALAGYSFARLNFKHKEFWFLVILITMMVPPQVNIIPLFFLIREMHLVNTYSAMILPGLFGGFGVFLMRQYFLTLPKNLEEAAKIDGCNIFQTFFKIAMPLAIPAIATLTIFTFVTTWNSFMWPLIITNTENMRTLPVGLAIFKGSFREITMWGDLMACAVICSVPVIIIFLAGKKYFLSDILAGSIKE